MKPVVLLDPGHGATDYAPKGRYKRPLLTLRDGKVIKVEGGRRHEMDGHPLYYREDLGTLRIAKACLNHLRRINCEAHLTRNLGDTVDARHYLMSKLGGSSWKKKFWSADKWVRAYANFLKSDIFVSIHTNAGGGRGIAGFYRTPEGEKLTRCIAQSLDNSFENEQDLDIRRTAFHKYTRLRGHSYGRTCLIECCFHDNPHDLRLLLNPYSIDDMGEAIAEGIYKYAKSAYLI